MSKRNIPAPVKPARSYEDQAHRLTEAHNLDVGDVRRAQEIFSTVNYYRLTTYGKHLRREDDPDRFVDGVTLEDLYGLYQFDMGLRHAILPVLEFFEVQLRAKLSYHLAMTYGSTGYTDAAHFRQDKASIGSHKSLMNKFKTEVRRQNDLPFVRHHKQKYGGQFPVWVAVELFSFGMLAQLFDILVEEDQWAISKQYRLDPEEMDALIASAVDVRNICAHYSRLYNQPIDDKPLLLPRFQGYKSDFVFPTLLMIRAATGDNVVYRHMIRDIRDLLDDYPQADLALCGFPQNWAELLSNA